MIKPGDAVSFLNGTYAGYAIKFSKNPQHSSFALVIRYWDPVFQIYALYEREPWLLKIQHDPVPLRNPNKADRNLHIILADNCIDLALDTRDEEWFYQLLQIKQKAKR